MIDYSLWEVIENCNAPLITKVYKGVKTIIAPATTEEKAQRRLELKARSTLLMGIPNEHQLKFNSIKDAKSLLQAVRKGFGGMLKNLISQLKDSWFESISLRRCESEVLKSSSSEWNTHSPWYGGTSLRFDTLSLDDLYTRFLERNTGRSFLVNGTETIGFDKSKTVMVFMIRVINEKMVPPNFALMAYLLQSSTLRLHSDESNLLEIGGLGHINFKTMNNLVTGDSFVRVVAGNQSNGNAGTKACDDAGDDEKNITEEPGKEGGDSSKDSECSDQEKEYNVNSTNTVNAASINEVNSIGAKKRH
ncbi:hypothetical protein Tco_1501512 [Tanacetum coccineum]